MDPKEYMGFLDNVADVVAEENVKNSVVKVTKVNLLLGFILSFSHFISLSGFGKLIFARVSFSESLALFCRFLVVDVVGSQL